MKSFGPGIRDTAMRKILITGGAGFIGSHLAEALLEQGHEIVCLDDPSTGSLENILPLKDHPRPRFVLGSILEEAKVGGLFLESVIAYQKERMAR
jgi:UDP-glucose 4-epimerase